MQPTATPSPCRAQRPSEGAFETYVREQQGEFEELLEQNQHTRGRLKEIRIEFQRAILEEQQQYRLLSENYFERLEK
jgi:hypothetical protein